MSHQLIYFALEGLRYYHTYDRVFLGLSVALGFLGWSAYVIILVLRQHTDLVPSEPPPDEYKGVGEIVGPNVCLRLVPHFFLTVMPLWP